MCIINHLPHIASENGAYLEIRDGEAQTTRNQTERVKKVTCNQYSVVGGRLKEALCN